MIRVIIKESKNNPRVTLYTNPSWMGADIDYSVEQNLPTVKLDMDKVIPFEPMEKVDAEENRKTVLDFIKQIAKRIPVKPILVRKIKTGLFSSKYQIIDGHHRYAAHLKVKAPTILAKIVPDKEIEIKDKPNEESEDK